ncbi:NfeD family protein [Burkholderia lata]|uniref:NfeD family protein n=1 Tax=Burkholderia lata (strain ATCC 17760 / DSM 23089 / LMG 22485 / NCIMB 9086 / R18194 / 383) TaxID=482957 RepID=A0A6P2VUU2_BURL3|nr:MULTISPECIES: NfeD family protein [Burkholderia]MBN3769773.1 NfeD family protein [Burkholderia sp. Se-20378]MBN3795426.1 NfeD family protein [Burkholderia sp. Ac-20392]VWC27319.1 NfeD family protein [Burkholderia lata]VWC94979.1 NfeD family protein [Burkholderia lata]VWD15050.1 NfeD family protein [Burkholderia lata]
MMSGHLFWWVAVGVLVVAELLTGTFYLLMIALGFLAGGLLQLAGFAPHVQFGAAAAVAIVAMVVLRRSGLGRKQKRDTSTNPDVNLDIGATVTVDAWRDGRARVQYRGADWDVELENGERDDVHVYQVSAVRGNCLVVVAKPAG